MTAHDEIGRARCLLDKFSTESDLDNLSKLSEAVNILTELIEVAEDELTKTIATNLIRTHRRNFIGKLHCALSNPKDYSHEEWTYFHTVILYFMESNIETEELSELEKSVKGQVTHAQIREMSQNELVKLLKVYLNSCSPEDRKKIMGVPQA